MRQAIMVKPGVIELQDVPAPAPKRNEVLLRIKHIGVCGSDIHVWHGKHPFTSYPIVQGHEFSALVEEVGKNVKNVKPGMRVTARPQLVCNTCGPCRQGKYHVCQNLRVQGFQASGCAQDFMVVPEDRLVVFPDSMSFEQGALIEPVSVGAHSTRLASELRGKNVVVTGAGTIGNIVAQVAKARGAHEVLITDISSFRLEIAKKCRIQHTANVSRSSFEEAVKRIFKTDGFHVGFEAVGVQSTIDNLLENIEKGSELIILGVFSEPPRINMAVVVEHELKLIGSMMYCHEDYEEAVEYIANEKIITKPLITKHFPLEQYTEAYHFIEKQGDKTMKVLIDL